MCFDLGLLVEQLSGSHLNLSYCSNLLLDYDLAKATVAGYAGTHDIVIVTFHGGAEGADVSNLPFAEETYFGEPRGDVVRFSRMVVDAGADFVFGHGERSIAQRVSRAGPPGAGQA